MLAKQTVSIRLVVFCLPHLLQNPIKRQTCHTAGVLESALGVRAMAAGQNHKPAAGLIAAATGRKSLWLTTLRSGRW